MKAVLIAALLCLAVIATEVATDKEVIITEFIENAKTSEFGQTILGTIELEIQNGSPGDVLVNMLDKIRQGQVSEIKSADESHAKVQGQCKATLSQLKGEIKQHARNVIKSKEVVKKSSIQLAWSENQLEQQQRQQKELKLGLSKIQGIREKEADVFEKKINEINAALQVLHEGKSKIEKQFGSTQSFIEVKDTFQSYVQKMFLEIEKPEYHGRGYVSIISYLSELIQAPAVVASKGGVQKILQLIQQIIDELQRAKTAETKAEDERLANFKELVDIYNKGIKDCDKAISNLNQAIGAAKEAITYNKRRIIDNTRAIRNKGRQQRKEKQKCRLEQRSYDKESKERNSELTVIEEALKLIKENIDEFRKIVLENSKAKIAAAYGGK